MSPLTVIIIGALLFEIGVQGQVDNFLTAAKSRGGAGYVDIPFVKFAIGGAIASIPLWAIPADDSTRYRYVVIILLAFLIANRSGAISFSNELQALTKKG